MVHKTESDPVAKRAVADLFCSGLIGAYEERVPLAAQPDAYSRRDFILYSVAWQRDVAIEAERKECWPYEWPDGFPTVDVPGRKWKNQAELYGMVSFHCDNLFLTRMQTVQAAATYSKNTKYTLSETFYAVDPRRGRWFRRQAGVWSEIAPPPVVRRLCEMDGWAMIGEPSTDEADLDRWLEDVSRWPAVGSLRRADPSQYNRWTQCLEQMRRGWLRRRLGGAK